MDARMHVTYRIRKIGSGYTGIGPQGISELSGRIKRFKIILNAAVAGPGFISITDNKDILKGRVVLGNRVLGGAGAVHIQFSAGFVVPLAGPRRNDTEFVQVQFGIQRLIHAGELVQVSRLGYTMPGIIFPLLPEADPVQDIEMAGIFFRSGHLSYGHKSGKDRVVDFTARCPLGYGRGACGKVGDPDLAAGQFIPLVGKGAVHTAFSFSGVCECIEFILQRGAGHGRIGDQGFRHKAFGVGAVQVAGHIDTGRFDSEIIGLGSIGGIDLSVCTGNRIFAVEGDVTAGETLHIALSQQIEEGQTGCFDCYRYFVSLDLRFGLIGSAVDFFGVGQISLFDQDHLTGTDAGRPDSGPVIIGAENSLIFGSGPAPFAHDIGGHLVVPDLDDRKAAPFFGDQISVIIGQGQRSAGEGKIAVRGGGVKKIVFTGILIIYQFLIRQETVDDQVLFSGSGILRRGFSGRGKGFRGRFLCRSFILRVFRVRSRFLSVFICTAAGYCSVRNAVRGICRHGGLRRAFCGRGFRNAYFSRSGTVRVFRFRQSVRVSCFSLPGILAVLGRRGGDILIILYDVSGGFRRAAFLRLAAWGGIRLRRLNRPGRQGQGHGRCQNQCRCFSCEMVFSAHCVPF